MPVLGISDYLNQLYIVQIPCLDLIKGYFQFEISLSASDFTSIFRHQSLISVSEDSLLEKEVVGDNKSDTKTLIFKKSTTGFYDQSLKFQINPDPKSLLFLI
jgi:hypothetical protein